jgi:hypothetical protein
MDLPERLRDTTLGDVLAALHRNHATGVLELTEACGHHRVHLRRGLVQAVETNAEASRLGDLCVVAGYCARDVVERVANDPHGRMQRLGQRLVGVRAVSHAQRDEALDAQRRRRLEALYALRDARLRFSEEARPLPPGGAEQRPMSAREMFHHRARRRDRGTRVMAHAPDEALLVLLGLSRGAPREELRRRFRERVRALHPDLAVAATETERSHREAELRVVLEAYRAFCG